MNKRICFTLFLFTTAVFLFAGGKKETRLEEGTHIAKVGKDYVFTQVLSFPEVPGVDRYEINLEAVNDDETTTTLETIPTKINQFKVSLVAGLYRYRINAFDASGVLVGRSQWQNFEILSARQPVAKSYQPVYAFYFELNDPERRFIIHGTDLYADSEYALIAYEKAKVNYDWTGHQLDDRKAPKIFPDSVIVNEDHTRAELTFNITKKELKDGYYDVFVRNVGGLWTLLGRIRIGYKRTADVTLSAGWAPELSFSSSEPKSAYFRFGILPLKYWLGYFGVELSVFNNMNNTMNEKDEYPVALDVLYQKILNERLQFNARAGISSTTAAQSFDPYFTAGASIQFFIWKNLYAEAGLDFVQTNDGAVFRPTVGAGWQLGRWAEFAEVRSALKQGLDPSVPVTDIPGSENIFSLGWAPVFDLSDSELSSFNPGGASLRFAVLPAIWNNNKFGLELELAMLDYQNRDRSETFLKQIPDLGSLVHFNLLYQRVLGPWQFNGRAGLGASRSYKPDETSFLLSWGGGVSAQFFFWKGLYAEAGLEGIFGSGRAWLVPGLGLGWQFNRGTETGIRSVKKTSGP